MSLSEYSGYLKLYDRKFQGSQETLQAHFWNRVACVLCFTAMTKPFRKPRIRKFGDVSQLTRQKSPNPAQGQGLQGYEID